MSRTPTTGSIHWDGRDGRVAAVAAAVVLSAWMLEPLLPTGVDPTSGLIGELAAEGVPYNRFFRGADRAAGILLVLAAGLGLGLGRRSRLLRASWSAALVVGLALLALSLLPLDCAMSADAACAAAAGGGRLSAAHTAHLVISAVAALAALAGTGAFALHRWRAGAPDRLVPLALLLLQSTAMAAALVLLQAGGPPPVEGLGVAQRVHATALALWPATMGLLPAPWERERSQAASGQ